MHEINKAMNESRSHQNLYPQFRSQHSALAEARGTCREEEDRVTTSDPAR